MNPSTPTPDAIWPIAQVLDPDFHKFVSDCEIYQLDNGMRVVLISDQKDRSSYFRLTVNAGAIHQSPHKRGIAHFVEHMLFQGTEKFASWQEIVDHAKEYNLSWNGHTGNFSQEFWVESDNDNESVEAAMTHLQQLVFKAVIPENSIEKERGVVLSERQVAMSEPDEVFAETYFNHFYDHDHPLGGGGILGYEEEIRSFSHPETLGYYQRLFRPINMVLTVVGGKSILEYRELIGRYFAEFDGSDSWTENPTLHTLRESGVKATLLEKDYNHVQIEMGYYLTRPDELEFLSREYYALRVAANALSRRVFLDLRDDKGLAYHAGAGMQSVSQGDFFSVLGEFSKENYPKAKPVLENYARDLFVKPVTEDELRHAKRMLTSARWARGAREVAKSVASHLFVRGQLLSPEGAGRECVNLSVDEVNTIVTRLLSNKPLEIIAVGPVGE